MTRSWGEVQALATRAAAGAGVPAAQALAFGAMLARHLADDGAQEPLQRAITRPKRVLDLAQKVEEIIEGASVSTRPIKTVEPDAGQRMLLVSWIRSQPCRTAVEVSGDKVLAALDLSAPGMLGRPDRLRIDDALETKLTELAARTYVEDSEASRTLGAGANLMNGAYTRDS